MAAPKQSTLQIAAVVQALQADEELAQVMRRQGRWRSEDRQQLVARLRGVLGVELSAKQMDDWLRNHKAAVVMQLGGPLLPEVRQGPAAGHHRHAPQHQRQPQPCLAGPQQQSAATAEVMAAFPEDMDAETRTALRAVAQLMHIAEDPAEQEELEAWDEREWRTLTAQICAGVKDPESAAAKRPCDDVCTAQQFRDVMAAALPQHVCAVCSRRRRQAEVQPVPLSQLRKWLDQHLDASLPPNEEVPRNGITRWVPPTAAEAQELLAAGQGATCKEGIVEAVMRARPQRPVSEAPLTLAMCAAEAAATPATEASALPPVPYVAASPDAAH
ncbi:hypothetical protein GPECTOR_1532g700 [Gonium pectorale]|uniref:Uncharacterized protein n=1 Tax=Gonium pectorale TaxID=33097 RepID=A0A150FTE8_GONPE|nr:hypothetical protein GPECTOR_1532g700 [Gonium pectorale]|eukprot:KXZ40884.1 hypothetical protein GPECTOR_1532g700 [Gonium pectorale]